MDLKNNLSHFVLMLLLPGPLYYLFDNDRILTNVLFLLFLLSVLLSKCREGNESIILEIKDQLDGKRPDTVITCVSGGGLLCGVVQGLRRVGWGDVPVVAMETFGAESFSAAVQAGELVTLPDLKRQVNLCNKRYYIQLYECYKGRF